MLTELPAGVVTPPMSEPIGTPIMIALPIEDFPGSRFSRDITPSPMLMKMAQAGTSEMTTEVAAVPTMMAVTTRRLSVPARASSQ